MALLNHHELKVHSNCNPLHLLTVSVTPPSKLVNKINLVNDIYIQRLNLYSVDQQNSPYNFMRMYKEKIQSSDFALMLRKELIA